MTKITLHDFCSALGISAAFPAYFYFISSLLPPKRLRNHTASFRRIFVSGLKMQNQSAGASSFSASFEADSWLSFLFFLNGWPPHSAIPSSKHFPLALNYLTGTTLLHKTSYRSRFVCRENLSSVEKPEWMYTSSSVLKFQGNRFG